MSHIDPERMVELAVDACAEPTADEYARLAADPELSGELARWRSAVLHATSSLERSVSWPRGRAEQLVEEILDASTRSAAGVPNWFASAWEAVVRPRSILVRVVAASLLFHLAALPVIAWFVHRAAREEPHIVFEPPLADPFDPVVDRGEAHGNLAEAQDTLELLDPDVAGRLDPTEVDSARRRSRYMLHRALGPDLHGREATTPVGKVLFARSRGLAGDWSALPDPGEVAEESVARAILAESYLDRALLTGSVEGLRHALVPLRPWEDGKSVELERWAAGRAFVYGWSDADLLAEWRTETWLDPRANPWGDPFAAPWGAGFARAVEGLGEDPVVEAWIVWSQR